MGESTRCWQLPDSGSQIECTRGPMAKHTNMTAVDAAGRVRETAYATDPMGDERRREKD